MRVHWVINPSGKELGNNLGYGSSSIKLRDELTKYAEISDDGNIAVHYCHPYFFRPISGKKNVLFTMFESPDLMPDFHEGFRNADLIIAPSKFCRDIFQPATEKPVYIVPLGVDLSTFKFVKRSLGRKDTFRIGYVGAPNKRKYSILKDVYDYCIRKLPNTELYIKTTGTDVLTGACELLDRGFDVETDGLVTKVENMIVDNRFLPGDKLAELYGTFHCFLLLTMGEGIGLTGMEAMATGLPMIHTGATGHLDYANASNSYPVKYRVEKSTAYVSRSENDHEHCEFTCFIPDLKDTVDKILYVKDHYGDALRVGRTASYDMKHWGWDRAGKKLFETLKYLDNSTR